MMKKKILIFALFLLIAVVMICLYCAYDYFLPKAEVIDYPDYGLINSIMVYDVNDTVRCKNDDTIIDLDEESQKALYTYISKAAPTRKQSVHDMVKPSDATCFYKVEIKGERISIYGYGYIYNINGKVYYEIPYTGIYRLNKKALRLLND